MLCKFEDNSPRVLDAPIDVRCMVCNRALRVRVFPVRCECSGSDLEEFFQRAESVAQENLIGLGDLVKTAIDTVTFGLLTQKAGCGCERRQAWLNSLLTIRIPK